MPKHDISFDPPLMNAAGILGFTPNPHGPVDLKRLGAFITNPVSLGPRAAAQGTRYQAYPGGFLMHTGYPNPGLRAVLRRYAARWRRSDIPLLVHLLPQDAQESSKMAQRLEDISGVTGMEIGIPPWSDGLLASKIVRAAVGELPVIVRLPMDRALELAPGLSGHGAAAISLGPPRGALPVAHGNIVHGRLYGPAIFPQVLAIVEELVKNELPVIAAGGIYSSEQIEIMMSAGAIGVQMDAVLWRSAWTDIPINQDFIAPTRS